MSRDLFLEPCGEGVRLLQSTWRLSPAGSSTATAPGRDAAGPAALLEVFKMVLLAQVWPHRSDTAGAQAGTNLPLHGVLHPEALGSVLPQKNFWINSEKHRAQSDWIS